MLLQDYRLRRCEPALVQLLLLCLLLLHALVVSLLDALLHSLLLQDPVVHEVEVEGFPNERLSEHLNHLLIVRALFKLQLSRVVHEMSKLFRKTLRQFFYGRNGLFYFDLFILLLFRLRRETLPRQASSDEIHKHHADLLKVVPSGLLDAQVCIQTSVPSRPCQLLIVLVADVSASPRVFVALGEPEVDDVNDVLLRGQSDQKVVRLYVTVEEPALVNKLNALQHLDRKHQDCLQRKLASTVLVQIFERRAKEVHHEHIVVSILAVVVHLGDADGPVEDLVELRLVVQLRKLSLGRLNLHCELTCIKALGARRYSQTDRDVRLVGLLDN